MSEAEAPERIWAWRQTTITHWSSHGEGKDTTEYVRADLFDAKDKCIAELEAKLAKAVEALADLADCVDDGCFCSEMQMATAMDNARTTLAELKGETE